MGYRITGSMPSADNEIAITKYQMQSYNYYGFYNGTFNETIKKGEVLEDSSDKGIIGKHLSFNDTDGVYKGDYKITGVIDTRLDESSKYESLRPGQDSTGDSGSVIDYMLMQEFDSLINYGMHNIFYVQKPLADRWLTELKSALDLASGKKMSGSEYLQILYGQSREGIKKIYNLSETNPSGVYWMNSPQTTLAEKQVLMSFETIVNKFYQLQDIEPVRITYRDYYSGSEESQSISEGQQLPGSCMQQAAYTYVNAHAVPRQFISDYSEHIGRMQEQYKEYGNEFTEEQAAKIVYASYLNGFLNIEYGQSNPGYNNGEYGRFTNIYDSVTGNNLRDGYLFQYAKANDMISADKVKLEVKTSGNNRQEFDNVEIAGYVSSNQQDGNMLVVSDGIYNMYGDDEKGFYAFAVAPMPTDRAGIRKLVELSFDDTEGKPYYLCMQNPVMSTMSQINEMIEMIADILLYVGLGLAVFAALLLANFISVSIANKKREIGILRAVGARSSDVFTIFFSESVIIALINFVLALAGTIAATVVLNNEFAQQLRLSITLLNFGIRQIALMFGVSIGVALIASFLPVYFLAKKRPIEAIRGR